MKAGMSKSFTSNACGMNSSAGIASPAAFCSLDAARVSFFSRAEARFGPPERSKPVAILNLREFGLRLS